ncbi:hypothetical protein ZWY2020_059541 [Hordeum vulgare]|nr:hypothetical protein ZWY2020_059541 [Hordeum vulgare]
MDRGEPSLKPEWLVRGVATPTVAYMSPTRNFTPCSVSRRHDRDGSVKSRGYASFGRSNRDRGCEKDSDFHDWESRLGLPDGSSRDGFGSFSSCRPESDRLSRVRPKLDTSTRTAGVSLENGNLSRKDAGGISFEQEFPHLSSEDNDVKQDIGRVPSPGISTPLQSIPLVTAPDGWNSVLAEVPGLSEPSNNYVSSGLSHAGSGRQPEVSSCGTALSMAETVMQAPLKVSTTPQLSIDAQKIEERTMRLRPLTPSSNKTSTAPQLSTQPSNSSVRTPVKSEPLKPSQSGSFQVLTRDQNGAANTVKDCSSNPVSPVLGQSSSVEPLKRSTVNHKLKGVVNGLPLHLQQGSSGERKSSAKKSINSLSYSDKSLNGSSAGIESSSSLIDEQKNPSVDLPLFNNGIKCIETGSSSCEDANSCDGSQRHLSDNEEIKPPSEPRDAFYEGLHEIVADNKDANSSSDLVDAEDEAKASLSIIPTDTTDVSAKSNSRYDKAESYPTEDEPSPEEMAFLKSLGWKEDEVVPPLKQEEIADCLRHNVRLQQKLEECRG